MSKHINNKAMQNGGFAQYSFDLNDNIGGLPARISLNNTKDGDCNNDSNSNMYSGGSMHRKHRKHSKSHKSKSHGSFMVCYGLSWSFMMVFHHGLFTTVFHHGLSRRSFILHFS